MDERFEALRRQWYNNPVIMHNIIERNKYRETAFISTNKIAVRCLKVNASHYMAQNFKRWRFFKEPFNVYHSLATYPDMPMFSFSPKDKRQEMNEFNKTHTDYIKGFDFMFDIDNPNIQLSYSSTAKVKKIFDKYQIPYWLQPSANKGFHLRVDYIDFATEMKTWKWQTLADNLKRFAEKFKTIENIPDIDLSVFDLRRLAKTPYSVVYPYYFIALPLSDAQFNDFRLKDISIKTLLPKAQSLRNRGVLKRQGSGNNFLKLIKDYLGDELVE